MTTLLKRLTVFTDLPAHKMQEISVISAPQRSIINQESLESQPASSSKQSELPTVREQLITHFSSKVETSAGYVPVLVCCFATGLTDGTVYNGINTDQCVQWRD
jgi:hypothetical protein